jgi:hypothetical protein
MRRPAAWYRAGEDVHAGVEQLAHRPPPWAQLAQLCGVLTTFVGWSRIDSVR